MIHSPHRAKLIRHALAHTDLPQGKRLGRAWAERLGHPERWELYQKKLLGAKAITLRDLERVAELAGGKLAIVLPPAKGRTPIDEIWERSKASRLDPGAGWCTRCGKPESKHLGKEKRCLALAKRL